MVTISCWVWTAICTLFHVLRWARSATQVCASQSVGKTMIAEMEKSLRISCVMCTKTRVCVKNNCWSLNLFMDPCDSLTACGTNVECKVKCNVGARQRWSAIQISAINCHWNSVHLMRNAYWVKPVSKESVDQNVRAIKIVKTTNHAWMVFASQSVTLMKNVVKKKFAIDNFA